MSHTTVDTKHLPRILAIGDIHGCSTALRALTEEIKPGPDDLIIVLGDFIDCGPDSRGVIEQLIALSGRCRLIGILGNHEEMLLNALESKSEYRYWLKLGGQQTLRSYSAHRTDLEVIPPEHVAFIRGCRNHFETQTHIFVHANYEPALPMYQIDGGKLRWEHLDVSRLRPHSSGKTVVVGHTPQGSGTILDLGFLIGIDTDCFRGGWLTALDVGTGEVIQADERGGVRAILEQASTCRGKGTEGGVRILIGDDENRLSTPAHLGRSAIPPKQTRPRPST
jgi:serine/threonine protein phosphatase 1